MKRALLMLALCSGAAFAQRAPPPDPLARDPSQLPRAEAGKWSQWTTFDPVPKEFAPYLGAGIRDYTAGDYGPALERFFALLERAPDYPPALYQAGLCYFRLRRYRDCASLVERFSAVAPREIGATQVLGHCYYSLGDYERAKQQYERVLAESPKSIEALRGYGLTMLKLGDPSRALELLKQVIELKPDHADAEIWIAQILYDQGKSDEALVAVRRAKELDAFEPRVWFLESKVLLDLGRDDEAKTSSARFDLLSDAMQQIRQIEGLMLHDPHQLEPMKELIRLQASIGNTAAVREHFARLWRDRPSDVVLRIFALDTFVALKSEDDARRAATDLEKQCANEARAWKRLEDYYTSVRDRVKQIECGERYLRLRGDGTTDKK